MSGRSPYDNGYYICRPNGYPADFIFAMRTLLEIKTEENDDSISSMYSNIIDEYVILAICPPEGEVEELPDLR